MRCGSILARARNLLLWGLLLVGASGIGPAAAQPYPVIDHPGEYEDCMALARAVPDEALSAAEFWSRWGGGLAAGHCAAVALLELRRFVEAAEEMERLAGRAADEAPALRADLLAQAGQAWLLAGEVARARAAQSLALNLAPDDVELLIDRSISFAAAGAYAQALSDLDRALDRAPERADALVLRASARRHLNAPARAGADIARALALEPNNPEGLLERGLLRRLAGDAAGARADWERARDLAPGTPTADAAQANIERLKGSE